MAKLCYKNLSDYSCSARNFAIIAGIAWTCRCPTRGCTSAPRMASRGPSGVYSSSPSRRLSPRRTRRTRYMIYGGSALLSEVRDAGIFRKYTDHSHACSVRSGLSGTELGPRDEPRPTTDCRCDLDGCAKAKADAELMKAFAGPTPHDHLASASDYVR